MSLLSLFVIVGFTSFINPHTASAQPVEWSESLIFPDDSWPSSFSSIAYGDEMYVLVGGGQIAYSSDAVNWESTGIIGNLSWVSYGDGKFVAVGKRSNDLPLVYTSSDGENWNSYDQNTSETSLPEITKTYGELSKVSYVYDTSNDRGLFVAVGIERNMMIGTEEPYIIYSNDGVHWSKGEVEDNPLGVSSHLAAGYDQNGDVLLISLLSTREDMMSPIIFEPLLSQDGGAHWFIPDETTGFNTIEGLEGHLRGQMEYLNGEFIIGGDHQIFTSKNGTDWIAKMVSGDASFAPRSITYGDGLYIGVGYMQDSEWNEVLTYSFGGEVWEYLIPTLGTSDYMNASQIIYADGQFVILGDANGSYYNQSIFIFKNSEESSTSSKSSSIFGTRFCSAGVTTFCRPQNGFINNNPLVNIYTELLGLYQQLLSAMQGQEN